MLYNVLRDSRHVSDCGVFVCLLALPSPAASVRISSGCFSGWGASPFRVCHNVFLSLQVLEQEFTNPCYTAEFNRQFTSTLTLEQPVHVLDVIPRAAFPAGASARSESRSKETCPLSAIANSQHSQKPDTYGPAPLPRTPQDGPRYINCVPYPRALMAPAPSFQGTRSTGQAAAPHQAQTVDRPHVSSVSGTPRHGAPGNKLEGAHRLAVSDSDESLSPRKGEATRLGVLSAGESEKPGGRQEGNDVAAPTGSGLGVFSDGAVPADSVHGWRYRPTEYGGRGKKTRRRFPAGGEGLPVLSGRIAGTAVWPPGGFLSLWMSVECAGVTGGEVKARLFTRLLTCLESVQEGEGSETQARGANNDERGGMACARRQPVAEEATDEAASKKPVAGGGSPAPRQLVVPSCSTPRPAAGLLGILTVLCLNSDLAG